MLSSPGNHGHANADFVEAYLERERLKIFAKSLRGNNARRVRYYAASGRVHLSEVQGDTNKSIARREVQLAAQRPHVDAAHSVEIFDPRIHIDT